MVVQVSGRGKGKRGLDCREGRYLREEEIGGASARVAASLPSSVPLSLRYSCSSVWYSACSTGAAGEEFNTYSHSRISACGLRAPSLRLSKQVSSRSACKVLWQTYVVEEQSHMPNFKTAAPEASHAWTCPPDFSRLSFSNRKGSEQRPFAQTSAKPHLLKTCAE